MLKPAQRLVAHLFVNYSGKKDVPAMFTCRTNRQLLLLAVLLLVFAASAAAGPNAMAVVSLDLASDDGVGNRACSGDFDNNRIVEFADFISLVVVFGASSGDANYNALMDLDGNGVINFGDFVLFAEVFGTTCEPLPVVAGVTISPSSASIEEGGKQQFSATAYDSADVEISGQTFTWSSSDVSVATVDSSGLATAVDAGSTTITAAVDGKSGTATLTVTGPLRSRTGTIGGRNNYSSGGSVTLSETSDGKLRLSITGLSTPSGAPDVFVALYTSANINWPIRGSLPAGAVEFGEVTRQSGNKAWTFTPASGKNIGSWSHLILHCRLINREVGSASLGN